MADIELQRKYLKLADRAPDVQRLLNEGLGVTAIGKKIGCSRQHVTRIIQVMRLKKPTKSNEKKEAMINQINELRKQGLKYEEIGKKLGKATTTVCNLQKHGTYDGTKYKPKKPKGNPKWDFREHDLTDKLREATQCTSRN